MSRTPISPDLIHPPLTPEEERQRKEFEKNAKPHNESFGFLIPFLPIIWVIGLWEKIRKRARAV